MPGFLQGGVAGAGNGGSSLIQSGFNSSMNQDPSNGLSDNPIFVQPSTGMMAEGSGLIIPGPRFYLSDEYSEAILSTMGLVAYWRMNETTGNYFYDTLGQNDLLIQGGVTMAGRQGPTRPAVNAPIFNGTTGYAYGYPGNTSTLSGDFTVEFWCYITAVNTNGDIISTRNPSDQSLDIKIADAATFTGDIGSGSAWMSTSAAVAIKNNISGSVWWHVAYAVTSGNCYILVNGTLVNTIALSAGTALVWDTNHRLAIGAAAWLTGEFFNGSIAEVAVYNQALDQIILQNHYMLARGANPDIASMTDTFTTTTPTASWSTFTTGGATIDQTTNSGRLTITPSNATAGSLASLYTPTRYDLTESAVQVQVVQALNARTGGGPRTHLMVRDYVNEYHLICDTDNSGVRQLIAQRGQNSNYTEIGRTPYLPATHVWWRMREGIDNTTGQRKIFFETAQDGYTWTTIFSEAWQWPLTNVDINLYAEMLVVDTGTNIGSAIFDNYGININPVGMPMHPPQLPYLRF